MYRISILLVSAVLMLVTSCSVTVKTADGLSVGNNVQSYPVIGDLVIGQKVTGTIEWNNTPIKKTPLEIGKGNLVAETISKYDGDIIIEPQFIIETTGYPFFRHHKLTVIGYIGNYKSFRNATSEDLKALETVGNIPKGRVVRYNDNSGIKIFRK